MANAISPELAQKISSVASKLALEALSGMLPEARQQPVYVVAALSLAMTNAAAMCGVSYADLVKLVSSHYENAMLDEVSKELRTTGETLGLKIPDKN